ncbi:Xaa-Pro peptidase family protein [Marinobacter sp. HL-58]|uniref:M24 family metallopeptidase n=1 Tax=Marinobacter sp. HL-58 TaxID=1479237 RepID=UPI00047F96BA|nr:Xaa-Pro peptidase family protein [Marinobacter sp. HL-58]KPP99352.1 MAG: Xaa-Pro aminopeptidase [Marinobacter sp. HL-58]
MAKTVKPSEPTIVRSEDVDPHWVWGRPIPAPGRMHVDFEERVNYDRLHRYRTGRAREALAGSDLGAILCFDNNNIRYLTSSVIGEWTRDKFCRYALFTGNSDPYLWDFGSAAAHHRIYAPWLKQERCRAGMLGLRGSIGKEAGLFKRAAEEIRDILKAEGVADMPVGVDVCEPPMLFALQEAGLEIRDVQQVMLDARQIKSQDEITLLNMAATMVDGAYDHLAEKLRPGARENEMVALVNKFLYDNGSDDVEAINAVSGERCCPHPHNFTDRMYRPGDQAFFDVIQAFMGYRTCYYRTLNIGSSTKSQEDAYKQAREWIDSAIELVKPGMTTDKIAAVWPKATDFGFANEMEAFGLQFGHGLGMALHERPIISRLVSFDSPFELQEGMVFALETYCPAADGNGAARIEEEVVVTPDGCQVITLFPSKELFIANKY